MKVISLESICDPARNENRHGLKWQYPEILVEVANLLDCAITLDGFRQMATALQSRRVMTYRIKEGDFTGCLDDEKIDAEITPNILEKFPMLKEIMMHHGREEGAGLSTFCLWLEGFFEDVAYLNGDRPLPSIYQLLANATTRGIIIPVKKIKGSIKGYETGVMQHMEHGCIIFPNADDVEALPKTFAKYKNIFEMALDGWKVD